MKTGKGKMKMGPPDGGWGWLIVSGSCLINIIARGIEPSFGLLFGDLFKQLGVDTTGASLIASTQSAILNFSGLIVGPLIKTYTSRKVAILGGVITAAAFLLTAPANSMLHILITFGVLGGIGFGLANASTFVVINDYFSKKKGQAFGLTFAGTAVGFMLMPHIVRFLLDEYDFRSAILILGALSLHILVGACLFQPVSWHRKAVIVVIEEEEANILLPTDKIEKKDISASLENTNGVRRNVSRTNLEDGKSLGITDQESDIELGKGTVNSCMEETHVKEHPKNKPEQAIKKSVRSRWSRFLKLVDLDLLRDCVYLNILYGLSMLEVVETNIKLILPFFLSDLGLTHFEIATALSSMALSDICARIVIPPIIDRTSFTRRATFILGSICVAIGRTCLTLQTTIGPIITTLVIIGFLRGILLPTFPVVLSEYSSGNNYPSVLGLSMVSKGIFSIFFGPLSGYIRDVTNSYPLFIHFQTLLMASVVISWTVEIIILKSKNKKQAVVDG